MAAAWMAHCGVKARIVDKRNSKIFCGQADGLQCRSLEIFDSLGFSDRVWHEANHMLEVSCALNMLRVEYELTCAADLYVGMWARDTLAFAM